MDVKSVNSFFVKLANGEYGLAKTFWLFNILPGVVISVFGEFIITPIFLFVYIIYLIPLLTGLWISASKYQGLKVWSVLTKIHVVMAALSIFSVFGIMAM